MRRGSLRRDQGKPGPDSPRNGSPRPPRSTRGRRLYIQGFRNELRAPHFTQRVRPLLPLGRTAGEFVLTLHAQQPLLQLVT